MCVRVQINLMYPHIPMPGRGSADAAGYDICSAEDIEIPQGTTKMIHTGIRMAIPPGYFGAVFARSGLASKRGLRPANCVGVIDSDYRGELLIAMHNDSDAKQTVSAGDRIAQIVFIPYAATLLSQVDTLDETPRGDGGFGSTGYSIGSLDAIIPISSHLVELSNEDEKYHQMDIFEFISPAT